MENSVLEANIAGGSYIVRASLQESGSELLGCFVPSHVGLGELLSSGHDLVVVESSLVHDVIVKNVKIISGLYEELVQNVRSFEVV